MSGRVLIAPALAPLIGLTGTATAVCIIDKCVMYNSSASPVSVALHLQPVGATIGAATQVGAVTVPPGVTLHGSEVVGAWMSDGYKLVIIPSIAAVLTVYAGARE